MPTPGWGSGQAGQVIFLSHRSGTLHGDLLPRGRLSTRDKWRGHDACRLVSGLRARGQRVSLIRPRQAQDGVTGIDGDERLVMGLPIPGYTGLNFGLSSKRRLCDPWQKTRPDIVHIATEGPLGRAAIAAARSLKIPVVAGFHTNFHNYSRYYGLGFLDRPLNAYLRRFHNRAQLTLVPTRHLVEQLEADGYRNRGVMARGVDTSLFHPQRRDLALRQYWGVSENDVR